MVATTCYKYYNTQRCSYLERNSGWKYDHQVHQAREVWNSKEDK